MQLNITFAIIIITVIISIGAFNRQKIVDDLIFYPPAINRGQWYRFFTCGFIHGDTAHLIFNMLSLYFFGPAVERAMEVHFGPQWGKWVYLLLYLTALAVSLIPTYIKHKDDYRYRSLGASGAVSAVLFAGLLIAPTTGVGLIFLPGIYIPGFVFGPLYLLFSAYLDRRGGDNINHSAHIWGALYGIVFLLIASKLVGYDIISDCITQVRDYIANQGWRR